MDTQVTSAPSVSLDAYGGLLIDGRRASAKELETLLEHSESTVAEPDAAPRSGGFPPERNSSARTVDPFARGGILCLAVVAAVAAIRGALMSHTRAEIVRAFSGLARTADGRPPATMNPTVAALRSFLVIALVLGGAVAVLRWWQQRNNSMASVVTATLSAIGGVFVFARDLWAWTRFFKYSSALQVIPEALKEIDTWISLVGVTASLIALALLGTCIRRQFETGSDRVTVDL